MTRGFFGGGGSAASSFSTFGMAWTVDPRLLRSGGQLAFSSANRAYFMRLNGSKTGATGFRIQVGIGSGNISIGIHSNSGTGASAVPTGTPRATTGAVACPASGPAPLLTISGGGTFDAVEGDWIGFSCDNTTATFATGINTGQSTMYGGLVMAKNTLHPLGDASGAFTTTIPFYVAVE
jgi:hypothetical protein